MKQLDRAYDPHTLGVARGLLDHQLIDSDGRRCGKVDDVLLREQAGTLVVAGISTGPGASEQRVRTRFAKWLVTRLGRHETWIDWSEITGVTDHVTLARRADEYGLARGEAWAARVITKLPWRTLDDVQRSHLLVPVVADEATRPREPIVRLSALLGSQLAAPDGTHLGAVHELAARTDAAAWTVTDVEVGAASMLMRLGLPWRPTQRHDPTHIASWSSDPLQLTSAD
jgi:sporulation protein YlmC with PRC-barrel domain